MRTETAPAVQPEIVALTLNPAVDVSYEVDRLVPDQKNHATSARYDPGGNGINVARALKELMVPAHSCCVAAGQVGGLLQRLLEHTLDDSRCVTVAGETRINATILQGQPPVQYEVTGIGPYVSPVALAEVREQVLRLAASGYAVLTGSLPPGVPDNFYGELMEALHRQGARTVLDAHGPAMDFALRQAPFLIKPNAYELSMLSGRELPRLEDVAEAARGLQGKGVHYVCVSLGAQGALLVGPEGSFFAKAPKISVRSTVGAGDSMVGGLVAAFSRGYREEECLRLGVACGSGTAAEPGTAIFSRNGISHLLRGVEVASLDI